MSLKKKPSLASVARTLQRRKPVAADEVISKVNKGNEVCVFVSDMSGFTRITREHGIKHMASIIVRLRQIAYPIFKFYNAITIETEADNFFCTFKDPVSCFKAAFELVTAVTLYNQSLSEENKHFTLGIGGIGLDVGDNVLQEHPSGKLYGECVNSAFLLGEDLAEKQLLITKRLFDRIHDKNFATFTKIETESDADKIVVGDYYYAADLPTNPKKSDLTVELPPFSSTVGIGKFLLLLAKRHQYASDAEKLTIIDNFIDNNCTMQATVLMVGINIAVMTAKVGIEKTLRIKGSMLKKWKPIKESLGGVSIEDTMLIFDHPHEAVAAAIKARQVVADYNEKCTSVDDKIVVDGFGIHSSSVLFLPETDLHWGDAVNTASKLGEDLAENGDILITDTIYDVVKDEPKFANIKFASKNLEASSVSFAAFSVSGELQETEAAAERKDLEVEIDDIRSKAFQFIDTI